MDFLQGCVWAWCNANGRGSGKWFSAHDFLAGNNRDWTGTPRQTIFDNRKKAGISDEKAYEQAGKDAGMLLKRVLAVEARTFDTRVAGRCREYTWV